MSPLPNIDEPAPDPAARTAARIVTAAWPTGLARLGVMVTACERCAAAEPCREWLARAPKAIEGVPPFCPNAGDVNTTRKARG